MRECVVERDNLNVQTMRKEGMRDVDLWGLLRNLALDGV